MIVEKQILFKNGNKIDLIQPKESYRGKNHFKTRKEKSMIYFDNAATTPLSENVKNDIKNNLDNFGNPSSIYSIGFKSKEIIENARKKVAECINCKPTEVFFTSGASESNTWALQDLFWCNPFEHHSILNNPNKVYKTRDAYIITCMLVNNELGIDFTDYLAELRQNSSKQIHCDATQAIGTLDVDVQKLGVDTMSFSGHKFHAPKGTGVLYIKEGIELPRTIYGGKQESGLRGGTENILGISALGVAIQDAYNNLEKKNQHCKHLKNVFLNKLKHYWSLDYEINATEYDTVPNIISFSLKDIESEPILTQLDLENIYVSSGSACNTGTLEPSKTLKWYGIPEDYINGTIRVSFDLENTEEEIDIFLHKLAEIVKRVKN